MKKTLLSVAAIALFATTIVSCQNDKKGTEGADSTKTEVSDSSSTAATTETPAATTETPAKADVPTFSSEEVNKSLAEFNTLKDQYVAALKSKNTAEIQALGAKYATWAQTSSTFVSKLKADEVQKYTDYMTKVSKEWSDAAMTAAQ